MCLAKHRSARRADRFARRSGCASLVSAEHRRATSLGHEGHDQPHGRDHPDRQSKPARPARTPFRPDRREPHRRAHSEDDVLMSPRRRRARSRRQVRVKRRAELRPVGIRVDRGGGRRNPLPDTFVYGGSRQGGVKTGPRHQESVKTGGIRFAACKVQRSAALQSGDGF